MRAAFVPDTGDFVWLTFDPQAAAASIKALEGKKKAMIKQRTTEIHITPITKLDCAERLDEAVAEQEQTEEPEVAP